MSVRIATVEFEGASPISHSGWVPPKPSGMDGEDYERQMIQRKAHADANGNIVIPAMAWKWCILGGAQYSNMSVPGAGKTKFGGVFGSAVNAVADTPIGQRLENAKLVVHKLADVQPDDPKTGFPGKNMWSGLMNSDGKRGGGTRVPKWFPQWDKWEGEVEFQVEDDRITPTIFEDIIKQAGTFCGLGRFRPQKPICGTNGKFRVKKITWSKAKAL